MEKENPSCTAILSSAQEQRHARAMKTLKDAMLQLSASRNPSRSYSQQETLEKHIDAHLPSLLPFPLRTPDHPPYAEMITTAIRGLDKMKGSTKTAISSFIKSIHRDLPLAHEHLLTHHLENLVKVGKVVSVAKSLYTLPICNNNDSEKPQQDGEQQLIVVQGEIVERKMSNCDVNDSVLVTLPEKHPTTALAEGLESVDINALGADLMALPEKHSAELVEVESMGGDDGGLKHLPAVIEVVKPLQKKLLGCGRGRGRPPKKDNEVEQQQKIMEINETIPLPIVATEQPRCLGKPPKKKRKGKQEQPIAIQDTDGEFVTLLVKNLTAATEMVVPLQKELPERVRERTPTKTSEAEQLKDEVGKISETIRSMDAAVDDEDVGLASEFEISLSEEQRRRQESIRLEEKRKDKQQQELAMHDDESSIMEEPSTVPGTMAVMNDEVCPPSSSNLKQNYQQQKQGNDKGDFLNDQLDCMNISVAGQQQEEVKNIRRMSSSMAAIDDNLSSDIGISQSQEHKQRHQSRPLEKCKDKQEEERELPMQDERSLVPILREPSITVATVAVMKDRESQPSTLRQEHGREQQGNGVGEPPNPTHQPYCSIDEAEEKQENVEKHSETIPLLAATIADNDLASEFEIAPSQEQQQMHQNRHLEKKHKEKQLQELAMQVEDGPVVKKLSTTFATMAVMEDREYHPSSSNLKQENQQQKLGNVLGDFLKANHPLNCTEISVAEQQLKKVEMVRETSASVKAVDEDLASDFEISQSQEQLQKRRSQDKREEQELAMKDKVGSLLPDLKNSSVIGDVLKENHPLDCTEIGVAEQQQEIEKVGETSSLMAAVDEDIAYDFQISKPHEQQQKHQSQEEHEEEQKLAMQEEGSLLPDLKKPSAIGDIIKANHPLDCTEISVSEQQQDKVENVKETSLLMNAVDEDLASDFEICVSQEEQQNCQSQDKQEEEHELATQEEEGSLVQVMKEPSKTVAVVKDRVTRASALEQEHERQQQGNDVGNLPNPSHQLDCAAINEVEKQKVNAGNLSEKMSPMAAADDDVASQFEISQSQEQQPKRRSRRLEKIRAEKEQEELAMQDEEGQVMKEPSTPTVVKDRERCPNLKQDHEQLSEAEPNNSKRRSLRLARQSHQ